MHPKLYLKIFYSVFTIVFIAGLNGVDLEPIFKVLVFVMALSMIVWWFVDPYPLGEFIDDKTQTTEDE